MKGGGNALWIKYNLLLHLWLLLLLLHALILLTITGTTSTNSVAIVVYTSTTRSILDHSHCNTCSLGHCTVFMRKQQRLEIDDFFSQHGSL